jgi:hypothetical protein
MKESVIDFIHAHEQAVVDWHYKFIINYWHTHKKNSRWRWQYRKYGGQTQRSVDSHSCGKRICQICCMCITKTSSGRCKRKFCEWYSSAIFRNRTKTVPRSTSHWKMLMSTLQTSLTCHSHAQSSSSPARIIKRCIQVQLKCLRHWIIVLYDLSPLKYEMKCILTFITNFSYLSIKPWSLRRLMNSAAFIAHELQNLQ